MSILRLKVVKSIFCISSQLSLFTFLFHLGFFQTLYFIMYVVLVDFLLASLISATSMWFFSNKFLREDHSENVEWGYSFDVHINAQFPPLIILHFFMLIFYKVLFSQEWFIARLLGNTLWLLAIGYYSYITFLGYNSEYSCFFISILVHESLRPSECQLAFKLEESQNN